MLTQIQIQSKIARIRIHDLSKLRLWKWKRPFPCFFLNNEDSVHFIVTLFMSYEGINKYTVRRIDFVFSNNFAAHSKFLLSALNFVIKRGLDPGGKFNADPWGSRSQNPRVVFDFCKPKLLSTGIRLVKNSRQQKFGKSAFFTINTDCTEGTSKSSDCNIQQVLKREITSKNILGKGFSYNFAIFPANCPFTEEFFSFL